jgi:hypothetical protein
MLFWYQPLPNNSKSGGIVGLAYKGNQGDLGIFDL